MEHISNYWRNTTNPTEQNTPRAIPITYMFFGSVNQRVEPDNPISKSIVKKLAINYVRLVNETEDLASNVLPAGLLVVHDTSRSGKDDVAELTGRKELVDPGLDVINLDVETGGDDTNLVKTAVKENSDLTGTVVINELEVLNVACESVSTGSHNEYVRSL